MSVIKKPKKTTAISTHRFLKELEEYARGLRHDYEVKEWVRRGRRPLNLEAIQADIDVLKKTETILEKAVNRYGYSERKNTPKKSLFQLGFIPTRRRQAQAVIRAEIRRLAAIRKRHLSRRLGKGRRPDPLWGYRAQCLHDFIQDKTEKTDWVLVGETLVKHFPEIFKPASQPERNALGPWAYQLAKRFRRMLAKDPVRYIRSAY